MRIVFLLLIIVTIEAKKKRPSNSPKDKQNDIAPKRQNIDIYPGHFRQPVPFGHIFKEGFGDPKSNLKPPIDFLELEMVKPRTAEEAKEIWETRPRDVILMPKNVPRLFASPRDKYVQEQQGKIEGETDNLKHEEDRNATNPWFDWEANQHVNLGKRKPPFKVPPARMREYSQGEERDSGPKIEYFAPDSFDLVSNVRQGLINWTSCEEFGKSPNFHPKDIVNIDWVPFYVWTTKENHEAVIHRFSYPTKKLVKEYKEEFGGHLNKTIDWDQPKLVLKEALEMLLIAGDRAGMFHGVPHLDFPLYMKKKAVIFPTLTIRLKVRDPYLAIMHCEHQFAAIMAVSGDEPPTGPEKVAEAKTLKFRGTGYPVYREIKREKFREQAEKIWQAEKKENAEIKIVPPIVRDHFLGRHIK